MPLVCLLLLLAALVSGCGSDDQPTDDAGADSSLTASDKDEKDLPPVVARACAPYAAMVEGIDQIGKDEDLDAMAVELTAVMKEWAAQVPDLDRPPGMSAAAWRVLQVLAERITALPDEPSMAELEAVEKRLGPREKAAIEDASRWFRHSCGLD